MAGLHYCQLNEEQGQKRKDGRLDQSDEYFKEDERHGDEVREERGGNQEQDAAGENVAEQTEGERNEANELGKEFQEADHKPDRGMEIAELAHVGEEAEGADACYFNREKGDDGEGERSIEVRIHGPQERHRFPVRMVKDDTFDTRDELEPVADEDKQKKRQEEWGELSTQVFVFQGVGGKVGNPANQGLGHDLDLARDERGPPANQDCKENNARKRHPTHQ